MSQKKTEFSIQSPTRIDLSGGTLDCWPINAILSPVTTINIAIDIFTRCHLKVRDDHKIVIRAPDTGVNATFDTFDDLVESSDDSLRFFKEHIHFWAPEQGFEIEVSSQSPIGGGLGGSSSLSVSIFKTFNEWLDAGIGPDDGVSFCGGIEAKILDTPTGSQDYIPAFNGRLNIIDYITGIPSVTTMETSNLPFVQNISVFYTGKAHHSGINNWKVLKKFIEGDKSTRRTLSMLKEVSHDIRGALVTERYDDLPLLLNAE